MQSFDVLVIFTQFSAGLDWVEISFFHVVFSCILLLTSVLFYLSVLDAPVSGTPRPMDSSIPRSPQGLPKAPPSQSTARALDSTAPTIPSKGWTSLSLSHVVYVVCEILAMNWSCIWVCFLTQIIGFAWELKLMPLDSRKQSYHVVWYELFVLCCNPFIELVQKSRFLTMLCWALFPLAFPGNISGPFPLQFGSISPGFMNEMQVPKYLFYNFACHLYISLWLPLVLWDCCLNHLLCNYRFLLELAQLHQIWTSRNETRFVIFLEYMHIF